MKKFLCVALGLLALPSVAFAAISIPSAVPVTEPFGAAAPPVANWSTNVAAGFGTGSGEAIDLATMTTFINTQAASGINLAFPTTATNPPTNQNASARYNTNGQFIQTWPTTSTANVVLATLQNTSGTNITGLAVSYTSAEIAGTPAVEELPGHNIYWSPTGAAGSWTHVFTQPGAGTANFNLGAINIANNQNFYVLWADDNAAAGNPGEVAYTIDSASFTATLGGAPVPQFGSVFPDQAQNFDVAGLNFPNGPGVPTAIQGDNALQVNNGQLNSATDQVDLRGINFGTHNVVVGVDLKAWESSQTSDFEAAAGLSLHCLGQPRWSRPGPVCGWPWLLFGASGACISIDRSLRPVQDHNIVFGDR
jgi:hypothetical protein